MDELKGNESVKIVSLELAPKGGPKAELSRNFFGAYMKGRGSAGKSKAVCPYREEKGKRVSFTRAYRKIWFEGRKDGEEGMAMRYTMAKRKG